MPDDTSAGEAYLEQCRSIRALMPLSVPSALGIPFRPRLKLEMSLAWAATDWLIAAPSVPPAAEVMTLQLVAPEAASRMASRRAFSMLPTTFRSSCTSAMLARAVDCSRRLPVSWPVPRRMASMIASCMALICFVKLSMTWSRFPSAFLWS